MDTTQESPISGAESFPTAVLMHILFVLIGGIATTVAVGRFLDGAPRGEWLELLGVGVVFSGVGLYSFWSKWRRLVTWWRGVPSTADEAPWTVRPAWRTNEIPETEALEWKWIAHGVLWNGIAWPLTVFFLFKLQGMTPSDLTTLSGLQASVTGENVGAFVILVIPMACLGAAMYSGWMAIREILRWQRFGTSTLVMDTMPARLGGTMQAHLQTPVAADDLPEDVFHTELACYRRTYERDHEGDRQIVRNQMWQEVEYLEGETSPGSDQGLEVPLSFEIPSDLPSSTPIRSQERILWEARVHADLPGPDFEATFEVPVFGPDA